MALWLRPQSAIRCQPRSPGFLIARLHVPRPTAAPEPGQRDLPCVDTPTFKDVPRSVAASSMTAQSRCSSTSLPPLMAHNRPAPPGWSRGRPDGPSDCRQRRTPHRSPSALRSRRASTMSRKKHDTTPVAEAAELAHGLLGEDDAKPVSETRADWIEVLADTPAPDSRHIFSPAVGNLVCERIAAGATLNQIASEPGMPSRSTINRWCTDRPEFKRQYDIAVQLRADGLLEETIEIIDDKKEIVTETTTEDEDGTKRVSKAFTKEGLAYAMARINIRYKTLSKMLPRKWGDEGHGLGEPAPALEPPRNGDDARNMG